MGIFNRVKQAVAGIIDTKKVAEEFGIRAEESVDMFKEIARWRDIYKGESPWVGTSAEQVTDSLNIATAIINDLAIKCVSEIALSQEGDELLERFFEDEIQEQIRQELEYALALGAVVVRPYYDSESDRIALSWYSADRFIPTQWAGKKCIGGVFVDYISKIDEAGRKLCYTKLESHKWKYGRDGLGGTATVEVKAYKGDHFNDLAKEIPLSEVEAWANIAPLQTVNNLTAPLFVYATTPFSNNRNLNSKMGVSIFKDAEAIIERIDRVWDNLNWEIESSANKVFMSGDLLESQFDENGRRFSIMNSKQQRLYETLEAPADKGIDIYSPQIRQADITSVIKTNISLLCSVMHLDSGAYVYEEGGQAVTATEVVAKQQKTYQTICDIQKWLCTPLVLDTISAVRTFQQLYTLPSFKEQEIVVDFGDSILVDEKSAREVAMAEVSNGVRSRLSYLLEFRGMSEEEAQKEIATMDADKPKTVDFFGGA